MSEARKRWLAVGLMLLLALGLRAWRWPGRYEVGSDESGYLCSSLVLVEGITPAYKAAPAGPQIWLEWAWAQAHVARDLLFPTADAAKAPLQLRPFLAMNRALFDLYRDLSGMREFILFVNVALLLAAVWAAFEYGHLHGGVAAGLLAAGLIAAAPLFVDFSVVSRPYSMAWSFGVIAVYLAARGRAIGAAVVMGLAIGSRVEMVLLLPLAWWELWNCRGIVKFTLVSLLAAYAVAPWLLTGLPGNLRAIATIQFANPMSEGVTAQSALRDFAWSNGFGPAAVLFLAGLPLLLTGASRFRNAVLTILIVALSATLFKSTGYGLRHHGSAVLPLILGAAISAGALGTRWPRAMAIAVLLCLLLPLVQTARASAATPAVSIADWIESHVPSGTVLYIDSGLLKVPLPTQQAADAIWNDVTGPDAWRRKFAFGLSRFGLSADQMPRAMSEENLVQDRGSLRRWFILGGESSQARPRYDVRLIHPSPIFGVQIADVAGDFAKTGGVVIWSSADYGAPPASWGKPVAHMPDADGADVMVFSSPDAGIK